MMTQEQQVQVFNEFVKMQEEILLKKGNDYSNEDRLSNFKQVAAILNLTPEQVCLTLIAVKIARLQNLLKGKEINNESIEDSIVDAANYLALLYMLRTEIPDFKATTSSPFSTITPTPKSTQPPLNKKLSMEELEKHWDKIINDLMKQELTRRGGPRGILI